ncbi:MAG: CsiV family protein [Gammaproteobacteria bacterium]|jgi:hypothetical protein
MNRLPAILLCLLWALPGSASAQVQSYRVDAIVFLNKAASSELGRPVALPDLSRAIDPANVRALAAAGIRILPESQFALETEWKRLSNSARHEPLLRLAWVQKQPPAERGPMIQVRLGQELSVVSPNGQLLQTAPVEGSLGLMLGRFLHLEADLVYTQPGDGGYITYRLSERRRMRRDELHYLDSPRLGVLARVVKAD